MTAPAASERLDFLQRSSCLSDAFRAASRAQIHSFHRVAVGVARVTPRQSVVPKLSHEIYVLHVVSLKTRKIRKIPCSQCVVITVLCPQYGLCPWNSCDILPCRNYQQLPKHPRAEEQLIIFGWIDCAVVSMLSDFMLFGVCACRFVYKVNICGQIILSCARHLLCWERITVKQV